MARLVLARRARAPAASSSALLTEGPGGEAIPVHICSEIELFDAGEIFFTIEEWPVHLIEDDRAFRHASNHPAGRRAQIPILPLPFRLGPHRHAAGRSIGECPVSPPLVFEAEAAAQLNRVDTEVVQHVLVHDGQLLNGIVDVNRLRFQAERSS